MTDARLKPAGLIAFALGAFVAFASASQDCRAPGARVQWIADYCMLKMQTDDEIAVSGCIEKEMKKTFPSDCASNIHFKRSMCELRIRAGTRSGTVEQCLDDPAFRGRTVENNGIGS